MRLNMIKMSNVQRLYALTLLFLTIHNTNGNVSCPLECQCTLEGLNFLVDCSNQGLTELPSFDYKFVSCFFHPVASK